MRQKVKLQINETNQKFRIKNIQFLNLFLKFQMGCGTSMSQSQIMKQSTSPKKLPAIDTKSDKVQYVKTNLIENDKQQKFMKQNLQKQQTKSIQEQIKIQTKRQAQQQKVNHNSIEGLVYQSLPPIKQGKIYLFGQSLDQRKIVSLDLQQLKFQNLASRSSKLQQNVKYQPSDVIFQQSQQLQASHLYNKYSHPPYNFMFATYITQEKIFLCGGINAEFEYISDESFVFHIKKNQKINLNAKNSFSKGNNLLGLKFQKLQYMNQKRYSHMGAYFPMGKLAYVYVFGGRGQNDQTLRQCQKYSIYEKKWIQIAPMKIPRSTGFSLIFLGKIYVFGGYTQQRKRTKKIQVYDPFKNYWQTLDVKLHRGIEAGLIFSVKPNEILIMGGNMQLGTIKSVIKVNLAQKTYQWDSNMKNQRFLQKGGKFNDQIFIFGGDFQDSFQRYTIKDRKWRDQTISYKQFISPQDINSFTLASQTIEIKYDETLISKNEQVNDFQRIHIFGNDNFPCILQINISKWVLKRKPVPMALRLKCHMTIVKIKQGKYFICGGIDSLNQKCSKAAYLYYAGTNKTIQVQKMSQKKYQMAACLYQQSVYLFGGKLSHNGEIISKCQKLDLKHQEWKLLGNLSRQRTKAKTLVYKDSIFIWGGSDSLQNLSQIQIFNPKTQQFSIYEKSVPMSSEITGILYSNPQQIIIFSYNDLLNEQYCHTCVLSQGQQDQSKQKQDESGLICSSDIKINQVKVKLSKFNNVFKFGQSFYFITNKGILTWTYRKQQQNGQLKPQIIINQVQMLQFPVDKFSFPI